MLPFTMVPCHGTRTTLPWVSWSQWESAADWWARMLRWLLVCGFVSRASEALSATPGHPAVASGMANAFESLSGA